MRYLNTDAPRSTPPRARSAARPVVARVAGLAPEDGILMLCVEAVIP